MFCGYLVYIPYEPISRNWFIVDIEQIYTKWHNYNVQLQPQFFQRKIKWKHFPRYWPFVRGIHRSPVNSPHKGQWREALIYSLICAWINDRVNNREAGDLRRHRAHYDVIVMYIPSRTSQTPTRYHCAKYIYHPFDASQSRVIRDLKKIKSYKCVAQIYSNTDAIIMV